MYGILARPKMYGKQWVTSAGKTYLTPWNHYALVGLRNNEPAVYDVNVAKQQKQHEMS